MVEISQKVVALVTADKVNTAENYVVCPFKELDVMLTDNKIPENQLLDYQKQGVLIQ